MNIIVNDQLIEYRDNGSGRTILLLHGWGMSLSTFDQLSDNLSKNFRVIRLDFPGFGLSPKPVADWSVDDYARITGEFLHKLKIDKLHAIICHSFGGRVVIKGISKGYLNPDKVVFIGTAGVKPRNSVKKFAYKVIAKIGKVITSLPLIRRLQPKLRRRLYSAAGSTDYLNAEQMSKIFLNTINENLLDDVSNIKHPALLVWGENDTETPLSDANLILDRLSKGRLVTIPNAGHFVYIEAFDEVIKEIGEFLL